MTGRGGVWVLAAAAMLLAGCGQLTGPGGPREPGAKGAATVAEAVPEVAVNVPIDQALLDAAIRKAREFEALVARAEGGDDEAQFDLAERYAHGREVEANPKEAKRWYLAAADSGHDKARALLVSSYIRNTLIGYEPKVDFVRLLPWIKDAARSGDVVAQELLAVKYAKGEEVPRDYYEARRWLQALADRGFVGAQYSLAVMYHQGLGVEPDPRLAYKWFEAAAKQGDGQAQYMVALSNYYGRGVDQNMGEARSWAEKASRQSDVEVRHQALTLLNTLQALASGNVAPAPVPAPAAPGVRAQGATPAPASQAGKGDAKSGGGSAADPGKTPAAPSGASPPAAAPRDSTPANRTRPPAPPEVPAPAGAGQAPAKPSP